ncbi:hypothetical protein Droror1_Dr00003190 [Drosera rotundifolia]
MHNPFPHLPNDTIPHIAPHILIHHRNNRHHISLRPNPLIEGFEPVLTQENVSVPHHDDDVVVEDVELGVGVGDGEGEGEGGGEGGGGGEVEGGEGGGGGGEGEEGDAGAEGEVEDEGGEGEEEEEDD